MRNRFDSPYDAVLHLLDRQVLDSDGLMVCKVDDLELVRVGSSWWISALLSGTAALLPRLGGRAGERAMRFWKRMAPEQTDRDVPYRVEITEVADLTSAVNLSRPRQQALVRERRADSRQLRNLLECRVRTEAGEDLGHVLDVRIDHDGHRLVGLVVGRGRPDSLLGYDRHPQQGPAALRLIVRMLHRHSGYATWDQISELDWDRGQLTLTGRLQPLQAAS